MFPTAFHRGDPCLVGSEEERSLLLTPYLDIKTLIQRLFGESRMPQPIFISNALFIRLRSYKPRPPWDLGS